MAGSSARRKHLANSPGALSAGNECGARAGNLCEFLKVRQECSARYVLGPPFCRYLAARFRNKFADCAPALDVEGPFERAPAAAFLSIHRGRVRFSKYGQVNRHHTMRISARSSYSNNEDYLGKLLPRSRGRFGKFVEMATPPCPARPAATRQRACASSCATAGFSRGGLAASVLYPVGRVANRLSSGEVALSASAPSGNIAYR